MQNKPTRPIGITLLAILFLWIGGFGSLIFPIVLLSGTGRALASLLESEIHSHVASIALVSLGSLVWYAGYVLYLLIGIGLWRLRRWALKGLILLQWLGILFGVVAALVAARYEPIMAIGTGVWCIGMVGAILWYLQRPSVQWPFEVCYAASHGLPIPPAPPSKGLATWVTISIGVAFGIGIIGIFAGSLFYTVEKSFRSSDIYVTAIRQAQSSPCTIASLGKPINPDGSISGELEGGSHGSANLDIPIRGSKGTGTLHVEGLESNGVWTVTDLTLFGTTGQIHLLPTASSCN